MNAKKFCFNKGSRKTVQMKFLVSRLNSVTLDVGYSKQCGIHATKIQNRDARMPQGNRRRREDPRAASCASASVQRGKNFLVQSKGRSVKGAVPGQEDRKNREEGREDPTECKGKKKKKQ